VSFKRIPGDWSGTKYGEVYPGSSSCFKGVPVFGLSNSPEAANTTGNPAFQGVYCFGSYSRDYTKSLDLSFPLSTETLVGLEVGAVLVQGYNLGVAWKNGSSYGVDFIDYTAKYASAYFETRVLLEEKRHEEKTLARFSAFYETLPASTGITFSYNKNHAGYTAMTSITAAKFNEVYANLSLPEIGALQIKVAFTVSSNNAPTVEAFGLKLDSDE